MPSNFKHQKSESCGISFSSKLEAAVYTMLVSRKNAGEIKYIQVQDHVLICGPEGHDCDSKCKIEYIADFKCTRPDETHFFVEAKGFANEIWPMKRRLYMHYGPAPLEIWKGTHKRPYLDEVITPK